MCWEVPPYLMYSVFIGMQMFESQILELENMQFHFATAGDLDFGSGKWCHCALVSFIVTNHKRKKKMMTDPPFTVVVRVAQPTVVEQKKLYYNILVVQAVQVWLLCKWVRGLVSQMGFHGLTLKCGWNTSFTAYSKPAIWCWGWRTSEIPLYTVR